MKNIAFLPLYCRGVGDVSIPLLHSVIYRITNAHTFSLLEAFNVLIINIVVYDFFNRLSLKTEMYSVRMMSTEIPILDHYFDRKYLSCARYYSYLRMRVIQALNKIPIC